MNHGRLDDHKLAVSLILYAWMSLGLSGPWKLVACEGYHGLVSGKWGSLLRSNPHLLPNPSMGNFLLITLPWFMIVSIAFAGETSDKGTCRITSMIIWIVQPWFRIEGPKKLQHNVTNKWISPNKLANWYMLHLLPKSSLLPTKNVKLCLRSFRISNRNLSTFTFYPLLNFPPYTLKQEREIKICLFCVSSIWIKWALR